jgi:hypothetical protein
VSAANQFQAGAGISKRKQKKLGGLICPRRLLRGGVEATLLGVTLTAADIAQAEALGIDVKGMMSTAGAKCDDLKQMLGVLFPTAAGRTF